MSTKLWAKGEHQLDLVVERFTVGRDPELDQRLVLFDVLGSAGHARMLHRIGILKESELIDLLHELAIIAQDVKAGRFIIKMSDEDCHTAIENRLTAALGETGMRIHTGRSRNDQVIAAIRLYGREAVIILASRIMDVVEDLIKLAEEHHEVPMPGYTHTRQAMPSTMGLFFAAHAEALLDSQMWLETAYRHLNRCPLGSGSGYGVSLPLDRQFVSDLLGFERVQLNTLAVQNDRGKSEFLVLGAALGPGLDLGRLASDLIWFSSDEFGFIRLAKEITTGSSIMPQKRNPDVLELIRASAGRLKSKQAEIASIFSALTSGYHRDLQLTKEPFLEGLHCCMDMFQAIRPVLANLEVDPDRCYQALTRAIGATDVVYQRVAAGEPFRSAYRAVAEDPEGAVTEDPASLWRNRVHLGAPGALDLGPSRRALAQARHWINLKEEQIKRVWSILIEDEIELNR
jgi:argininosuccinate lyase